MSLAEQWRNQTNTFERDDVGTIVGIMYNPHNLQINSWVGNHESTLLAFRKQLR